MLFRRCFICLFFTLSSLYVHTYQPELDWNNVHSRVYVKRKKTKRAVKKNPEDLLASNKNNQVPSNIVLHDKRLQTNIKTLETANVLPTVNDKQPEEPSSSDMEDSPKANSYSLGDLLVIALKCNPLCKQAWAAYKASYETYRQNQSVYYPSISLTGSVERTRTKTGSTYKQGNNYKAGLDLSYLLYDFGKRESEVKESFFSFIAQNQNYEWQVQTVLYLVIKSYYKYLGDKANLEARVKSEEESQEAYNFIALQKEQGLVKNNEYLKARAHLSESKMFKQMAVGNVEVSVSNVIQSLGKEIDYSEFVLDGILEKPVNIKLTEHIDSFIRIAKERRLDLRALKTKIQEKQEAVKVAQRADRPSLNFDSYVNEERYQPKSFGTNSYSISGSLSVNVPLFQGYYYERGRHLSEYQLQAQQAQYEYAESYLVYQLIETFYQLKTSMKNIEYGQEFLKYAQESYQNTLENYHTGVDSFLSLISTKETLASARSQYVNAISSWYMYIANLTYQVGILKMPKNSEDIMNIIFKSIQEEE